MMHAPRMLYRMRALHKKRARLSAHQRNAQNSVHIAYAALLGHIVSSFLSARVAAK